jgi:SAM-dependent methyltransferase
VDFLLEELDLQPGGSVLDVGCGTGRHSIELAKRGYAATGLDLSSEMLARAAIAAKAAGYRYNGCILMPRSSHSREGTMLQSVCAKEPSDFSVKGMTRLINPCLSCATSPGA